MKQRLLTGFIIAFCLVVLVVAVRWSPPASSSRNVSESIGVIRVEGTLMSGSGTGLGSNIASSVEIMEALQAAQKRDDIKAVLIRIDSPGGTPVAAQEIGEEINKLKKVGKPVVASMGDVAASGAYWIAASCDEIYANPATTTGSIGVITEITNLRDLLDKLGIRTEVIKSGSYKDMGSSFRELTPQERQLLQGLIDELHGQFLQQVEKGRRGKMTLEEIRRIADGRVVSGTEARKLGLVDHLGNYYDALDGAARLAGITGEPAVVELNAVDPWSRLLSRFSLESLLNGAARMQIRF